MDAKVTTTLAKIPLDEEERGGGGGGIGALAAGPPVFGSFEEEGKGVGAQGGSLEAAGDGVVDGGGGMEGVAEDGGLAPPVGVPETTDMTSFWPARQCLPIVHI